MLGIVTKNKITCEDGNTYPLLGCYDCRGDIDTLYKFPQGYEIDVEIVDGKAVKTYSPPIRQFKTNGGFAKVYKKE